MLVRQVDRKIGLSAAVAGALSDRRDPERITHSLRDLLAQRLYGLCCDRLASTVRSRRPP